MTNSVTTVPSYPTYIIAQEPGMVPRRKGPFFGKKMVEGFLRDAYRYNPEIICIVIDMESEDNTWYPEHGYEWLDVNGDGRKRHPRKDRPKQPSRPNLKGDGEAAIIECLASGQSFVFDPATNFLHADDGTVQGIRYIAEHGDLPQSPWPASDWAIERIKALEAAIAPFAKFRTPDHLGRWADPISEHFTPKQFAAARAATTKGQADA